MSANNVAAVSAFIQGAPPGELSDVVSDINALAPNARSLLESARPAFKKYNEEQMTTARLPGGSRNVIISSHNALEDGRYFDTESSSSFAFDHITQKASDVQPYDIQTEHSNLIDSLTTTLTTHAHEHYPTSTTAIIPSSTPSSPSPLHLLLVTSKYSPSNFWNGRLRTTYTYTPTTSLLTGTLACEVHYYEDGNVRLTTTKHIPETKIPGGSSASEIMRTIARIEKAWQEELNRGFGRLGEGEFKGLRRQLPVTRQKVEWEKVGGYRAGKEIGGRR